MINYYLNKQLLYIITLLMTCCDKPISRKIESVTIVDSINRTHSDFSVQLNFLSSYNNKKTDINPYIDINKASFDDVKNIFLAMYHSDQKHRDSLHIVLVETKEQMAERIRRHIKNMRVNDSVNQIVLANIIQKYGWPTIVQFGDTAAKAAWYVMIHSNLEYKLKYISFLEIAAKKHKVDAIDYAILTDRILRDQGKKQIYGTHGYFSKLRGKYILLPIEDSLNINERRRILGLSPLKINACEMELGTYENYEY